MGCCEDNKQRTEKCCCDAVVTHYKELKEKGDKKLGKLKSSDPILGACRKRNPEVFDAIDFPPTADKGKQVEKKDDYSTLIGG